MANQIIQQYTLHWERSGTNGWCSIQGLFDIDVKRIKAGNYLVIDCYRALDPGEWSQVYDDSFLKRYATALMKRMWGQNLIKYNNVQLPGGVTLNGRQIWEDGDAEVKDLEARMLTDYSLPPLDMIG